MSPPAVAEWGPDGKILIVGNGLLARFDLDSGEETLLDRGIAAVAFNPAGTEFIVAGREGLAWRRYPGLELVRSIYFKESIGARVMSLAWSPDGETIAAGTERGVVELLSVLDRGEPWAELGVDPPAPVTRLRFSADSRRLLTAFADGRAVLWDLERREEVRRYSRARDPQGEAEATTEVEDVSPDGRLVLSTRTPDSGTPDAGAGEPAGPEMLLMDDRGVVKWRRAGYGVGFTPDGAGVLALVAPFRIAALYQTSDAAALRVFEPPEAVRTLHLVRLSPDGKLLLGVGEDHQGQVLIVWDVATAAVLKTRR